MHSITLSSTDTGEISIFCNECFKLLHQGGKDGMISAEEAGSVIGKHWNETKVE